MPFPPSRQAVADALEDLRKGDTVLDEFLARGEGDFFVKNLENVQGVCVREPARWKRLACAANRGGGQADVCCCMQP